MIKAVKTALPCWNVDTQVIWDAFRSVNRTKGNEEVPAGYLLGFMLKWRTAGAAPTRAEPEPVLDAVKAEVPALIRHAPVKNWLFHERDLVRIIEREANDRRVRPCRRGLE